MVYLGLDYGQKHIGVALADGPLAQPLTTIDTINSQISISNLISKYHINALVIGLPDGPIKLEVEKFVDSLKSLSQITIFTVDETLSSADARTSLLHTTQTRRKAGEHAASAAIILQRYLDEHVTEQ